MKIAFFDAHRFERDAFDAANRGVCEILYFEARLNRDTAKLARGADAVCSFVNDHLDAETLRILKEEGIRLIALRSAGYNHVDLAAAAKFSIPVVRVPEYSPYAVAEHAVALMLSLNRKIHHAYLRVRELNFSLDGLVGFDLHGKTVGVLGTGRIGKTMIRIMTGFGCRVLAHDIAPDLKLAEELKFRYVNLKTLYAESDIISLHLPLTKETRHLIDEKAMVLMKHGVMLINTGRGALIETKALVGALKTGQIGAAGLDVYEEEEGVFFNDLSDRGLNDDVLARLLTFPNVLVTSHQGFLTREALLNIAKTTLQNIDDFKNGRPLKTIVSAG
jgi:D-lactate dehydrogenase